MAASMEAASGAARKARERKRRAEGRHVLWLTSCFQSAASHHTSQPAAPSHTLWDEVKSLRAQVIELQVSLAAVIEAGVLARSSDRAMSEEVKHTAEENLQTGGEGSDSTAVRCVEEPSAHHLPEVPRAIPTAVAPTAIVSVPRPSWAEAGGTEVTAIPPEVSFDEAMQIFRGLSNIPPEVSFDEAMRIFRGLSKDEATGYWDSHWKTQAVRDNLLKVGKCLELARDCGVSGAPACYNS